MRFRKAPYKPSRMGWFFGFLEELDLLYRHTLVYGLAHIVDGQRGYAHGGKGLHLDAGTVARTGCRGERHAVLAYLELDVNGGKVQAVTEWYELWRLLGRHDTGDPGRIQHVALGQSRVPQQPYRLWRHAHDSPGDGGAPHHFLLPHVDHPGRALAVEVRKGHLFASLRSAPSQHFSTRPVGRLSARRPASPDGLSAFHFRLREYWLTRRRSRRADKRSPKGRAC